jgi:hypothetical protein
MNRYLVYYDRNTGKILLLTPEESVEFSEYIEIDEDTYCKLASRQEPIEEYRVGHVKTDDGKIVLSLLRRTQPTYIFKNTLFEWILNAPVPDTELVVKWNGVTSHWEFSLSSAAKKRVRHSLGDNSLVFFVILEHDFDFLIRTIFVDPNALLAEERVCIPFEEDLENKINKISIATRLTFQSYGLTIHE